MAERTPTITRRQTERQDWLDWLDEHSSFRFQVKGLFVSFRRERRRNGDFWYAYKRINERLHKVYAGRSEDLTTVRLVEIVETFRYR